MDSSIVIKSESVFPKTHPDESVTDLARIPSEFFDDGCDRFVSAGNETQMSDNIRIYRFDAISKHFKVEKTINHSTFTYSVVFIPDEPSIVWFDHCGQFFFESVPSFKRKRKIQLKERIPIWRGLRVSKTELVFLVNPHFGGGNIVKLNWRTKKSKWFPVAHKNEIWSMTVLIDHPNEVVTAGGSEIGDDSRLLLWNWKTAKLLEVFKPSCHKDRVVYMKSFVASKDLTEKIVSTSRDSLIVVWDRCSTSAERVIEGEHSEGFYCFMFVTNSFCLIGGEKGGLYTSDLKKGITKMIKENEHGDKIDQIFWTDYQKRELITCGRDGDIRRIKLLLNQSFNEDEEERIEFLEDRLFDREIHLHGVILRTNLLFLLC